MAFSFKRVLSFTLLAFVTSLLLSGKKKDPLYIETSTHVINKSESYSGKDVLLRCILSPDLAKKLNNSEVEFHFYARNDIKNIVFELTDQSFQSFKITATPVTGRRYMVFETSWNMLFYKAVGSSLYRWQWVGKAEPPLSPLADINGQEVKKIECWFTVHLNGKKYKSERIAYEINP